MKTIFFTLGFILTVCQLNGQSNTVRLSIQPRGSALELSWPGSLRLSSGDLVYPRFQILESPDLNSWQPVGPQLQSTGPAPMTFSVAPARTPWFYRLFAEWAQIALNTPALGGDKVFGYGAAFNEELARIGQISLQAFADRYSYTNGYLPAIDWDPTTARYWNLFAADPVVNNQGLSRTNDNYRYYDFRLNAAELNILRQNGFVVSPRLGSTNFADLFYQLWNDDLPVFISTDSMLQAWHRSYDNMLIELEYFWLSTIVGKMLDGMAGQLQAAQREAVAGALDASLKDADYFLTVARSLFRGSNVVSALGQETRVNKTVDSIKALQLECFTVFDFARLVDFSQFKPRGHYADNVRLQRYFQTVMWLGRTDLRVAGPDQDCLGGPVGPSARQLGTAIVLTRLLNLSGQFENWRCMDRVIQTFVGMTDSMTFAQLADLMTAAGIRTLADIDSAAALKALQARIEEGSLGIQNIRGDAYISPLGPAKVRLPRSFTVFGQKFVLDSWALTKVVYDDILWAQNGVTDKVKRRVPSCLDVAFSVLANNHIVPELVQRISASPSAGASHMAQWRDGRPYHHNLAAVRNVIDSQDPAVWNSNIYMSWLATLRKLSNPTTDPVLPQAMRTRAWALKSLNTQLASWTQLRHNTILYAKPSYTSGGLCSYPDAYVELRPGFWGRLERMATNTADMIQALPYEGTVPGTTGFPVELSRVKTNQVGFLRYFAGIVAQLRVIAEQELRHELLSPDQLKFINGWVESPYTPYNGVRRYNGWYPRLFYRHLIANYDTYPVEYGEMKYDALVVDVHNDIPDAETGDPGGILHEAVGKVNLLMIAIDSGQRRRIYAGPVLSHYEFETTPYGNRKTDAEWKEDLRTGNAPPPPTWTRSFLVP